MRLAHRTLASFSRGLAEILLLFVAELAELRTGLRQSHFD